MSDAVMFFVVALFATIWIILFEGEPDVVDKWKEANFGIEWEKIND